MEIPTQLTSWTLSIDGASALAIAVCGVLSVKCPPITTPELSPPRNSLFVLYVIYFIFAHRRMVNSRHRFKASERLLLFLGQ
jgi:hypothetical protein